MSAAYSEFFSGRVHQISSLFQAQFFRGKVISSNLSNKNDFRGIRKPALGVSVKSVDLAAGRLGFYSQSGHTKDFKNSIRSFRARRSAQAEERRV